MSSGETQIVNGKTLNKGTVSNTTKVTTTKSSTNLFVNSDPKVTAKPPVIPGINVTYPPSDLLPPSAFIDQAEYIKYLIQNGVPSIIVGTLTATPSGTYNALRVDGSLNGNVTGNLVGVLKGVIQCTISSGTVNGIVTGNLLCDDVVNNELIGKLNGTITGKNVNNVLTTTINATISGDVYGTLRGTISGVSNKITENNLTCTISHKVY